MTQALTLSKPLDGVARLWRAYPRETVGLSLLGLAIASAIGGAAHSTPELPNAAAAVPAPPPLIVRQLPPEQALRINQEIPLASGPNPAAAPFVFKGDKVARTRPPHALAAAALTTPAASRAAAGPRAPRRP